MNECERDINRYYFQVQKRKRLRKIFFFCRSIVCHSDPLLWIEASIMSAAEWWLLVEHSQVPPGNAPSTKGDLLMQSGV